MPLKSDTDSYRFSFNSKEKDDETYGGGYAYDFGARIYDSRLGRWFSIKWTIKHEIIRDASGWPFLYCL